MIKPQELRIGNHLNAVVSNGVETLNFHELVVNEIKADGIREEKGIIFPYENLLGTPLTEEWLIKFGFDNVRKNLLMCHNEYHNNKINEGAFYIEAVGDAFNHWYLYHKTKMITSNIRFIHQLQNLFFALTGEELTIKK